MEPQTGVEDGPAVRPECWCCGTLEDPAQFVRLGNHPEVTICTRCAHWVSKQAGGIEDRSRTGLVVAARDRLRRLRSSVIQHGWHRNRLIGRPLRWIGKHTP